MTAGSGARVPLVLVPGLLCDEALWAGQVAGLADVADVSIADTLSDDDLGAMADRLLAEAPARFALAGLSMGGYVALEVVRRASERVTHLALLDTRADGTDPAYVRQRRDFLALAERGEFRGITDRLLPVYVHAERLGDAAFIEEVRAMTLRVGRDRYVSQQRAVLGRRDQRDWLPEIRCPTLVLCGRQDQGTPLPLSEEMARLIPGARLVVVEDCGHLSTMERPEAVTAALREWLTA